jgi:cytochrome c556
MRLTAFTLIAAIALPGLAVADSIDDAIEARQGYYQVVKLNAGLLFGMAQGKVDYDAAAATSAASDLQALANLNNGGMWPMGSSKADRPGKTRALPVIWETYPAVLEKSDAFKKASATLAGSAGGGLDALRADIQALGASCTGCHDTYRAKDF